MRMTHGNMLTVPIRLCTLSDGGGDQETDPSVGRLVPSVWTRLLIGPEDTEMSPCQPGAHGLLQASEMSLGWVQGRGERGCRDQPGL